MTTTIDKDLSDVISFYREQRDNEPDNIFFNKIVSWLTELVNYRILSIREQTVNNMENEYAEIECE